MTRISSRPVIFIAGPYRASTPWGIKCNVHRAKVVAVALWQMGFIAYCPHANSEFFDGIVPDEVFLEGAQEMLTRCDAVFLIDTWAGSAGAKAERELAQQLGRPIFRTYLDAKVWLQGHRDPHAETAAGERTQA